MPNLNDVERFLEQEAGLATISTTQADGRVLSSIVNCGVVPHPVSGEPRVGLVSGRTAARLLREIFLAAGGTHENFDHYDTVMAEEGRTALLIAPERILGSVPEA